MEKMNKELFVKEVKKLNINITDNELNKLDIYYKFLKEYNKHTNLTTIIEERDVYLKHFYDSLTILKVIDLNIINNLLDIGTGAGFPGVVLKIFYPNINLTLLDSNNKKTKFLNELTKKLELKNVEIINDRSENYIKFKREQYDLVTSRAVADLKILSELSIPFVQKGGYFIPLKGDSTTEIEESEYAIKVLGGEIITTEKFLLPEEKSKRTIIKILKKEQSPIYYPRPYDKILKKPLKIIQK